MASAETLVASETISLAVARWAYQAAVCSPGTPSGPARERVMGAIQMRLVRGKEPNAAALSNFGKREVSVSERSLWVWGINGSGRSAGSRRCAGRNSKWHTVKPTHLAACVALLGPRQRGARVQYKRASEDQRPWRTCTAEYKYLGAVFGGDRVMQLDLAGTDRHQREAAAHQRRGLIQFQIARLGLYAVYAILEIDIRQR